MPPFAIGDGLTNTRTVAIASAYLNTDNNVDIVTGDADQVITVLLGNGDGTFQAAVDFAVDTGPVSLAASDFNSDGLLDLAVVNEGSNNVSVLINNTPQQ